VPDQDFQMIHEREVGEIIGAFFNSYQNLTGHVW